MDVFTRLILFSLFGTVFLFGVNYFLYYSVVRFFSIVDPVSKTVLFSSFVLLTISFIVFSFLSHWHENVLIRGLYIFSGLWAGVLLNLIVAASLVWILILSLKFFGYDLNIFILSALVFTVAVFYSFYGVWNAFNLKTKDLEVGIKNLPEHWENKKIVLLSDLHLGYVNGPKFLGRIVETVKSMEPDVVAITGDLFDSTDGKFEKFIDSLNSLSESHEVLYVTGNHENYIGLDNIFSFIEKTKIKVLNDTVVNIDGLQFIGIGYAETGSRKNIKDPILAHEDFSLEKPSILLYHLPVGMDQARELAINLQLSGHTHRGQLFPLNLLTKLIFKGYDYGLHDDGDFAIYTTSGIGPWGPAMRTGSKPEIVSIKLNRK